MKNILIISSTLLHCILFTIAANAQNLWQPLNGPSGGPVYNIITGNQSFDFCITPSGIYRTSNDGDLWTQSTPIAIKNLYVGSAGNNGYIYAATTNYTTLLYRSSDNGNSWEQRLDGGLDFNAVAASPNGTIFAGTFYMFSFHGQFIQDGEIFRSNDNGNSWTSLNFPPLAISNLKINSNNEIFVATTEGLFRSANNGGSFGLVRSGSVSAIYINSQNHVFIQTTGYNILRSTNNGSSWTIVGTGPEAKMPIAEDPFGNLFSGFTGKLYKSTDNGLSWNLFAELIQNSFNEVSSIHFKPGNKIIVSTSNGIFRSDNNGLNWSEANNGIRDPQVRSMAVRNNTIFTASANSVSRSLDNGNTWQVTENGLPHNIGARIIETGSSEFVFVYMQVNGLYSSSNNGNSWSLINNLPSGIPLAHLKAGADNKLYVTNAIGRILRSTNNGDSWTDITSDLPDSIMFSGLALDHQNNIYTSVQTNSWFTLLKGIYKSTNDGTSWVEINNEIVPEEMSFNSQGIFLAKFGNSLLKSVNGGTNFSPITSQQEYVIEYTIGSSDQLIMNFAEDEIYYVKKSIDNGATWTDITGILNNQLIYDLQFDVNSSVLAATQSGVYRTTSPTAITTSEINLPGEFLLMQNYPNPYNPNTVIRYQLGVSAFISLKVYDVLGNEVALLVNKKQNAGNYSIEFDGSNLSSGIYFYMLKVNEFSETKKMLLVK